MSEVFYDLAMAVLPGSIAGYYSALLTAKFSKFNSLKYEALRIARYIDFIGDQSRTQILRDERSRDMH